MDSSFITSRLNKQRRQRRRYKDKTFANEIEKALEKEFPDGAGDVEGSAGRSFNTSLTAGSAKLESVARITRGGHLVDGDGNVTRVYKVGLTNRLILAPPSQSHGWCFLGGTRVALGPHYRSSKSASHAKNEAAAEKLWCGGCDMKRTTAATTDISSAGRSVHTDDPNEEQAPSDTRICKNRPALIESRAHDVG